MTLPPPPIPLEDLARYPLPGFTAPDAFAFSPDDRLVTCLFSPEHSLVRQLYACDTATGERRLLLTPPGSGALEENLSREEKLRRERQRMLTLGVTHYAWANQGNRLLAPLPDGLYVQDGEGAPLCKVVDTANAAPALDPRFSPDGELIAYMQTDEIWLVPARGGPARQLTHGAHAAGRTHGLADYIAQEEMGRQQGYWWSPQGDWIAFEEVDESHIPLYHIVHQGKDFEDAPVEEEHRYPFAGKANPHVRLGLIPTAGGQVTWLDLGPDPDIYLARAGWLPDGRPWAQVENREQTSLDLLIFDPHTGQAQRLLHETSAVWINLHDMFHPLKEGAYAGGFIWGSERTGFRHLYLYDAAGNLVRPLTGEPYDAGEWQVDELCAVDEGRGLVYFTASKDSPLEHHLYAVSLNGGAAQRITQQPGTHMVTLDHRLRQFVDLYDSLESPPSASLRLLEDGALLHTLYANDDPRLERLQLQPPQLVSLLNRHGDTLYGMLYRPPAAFGNGPFPLIVYVYGGPHVQLVTDGWFGSASMRAQAFSRLGYLVLRLDNRGSYRRGLAFEGVLKHHMGHPEVDDQVDGVRWLVTQGLADSTRVGIIGWSYGGYMAAMCLLRSTETFKVAVSGAPVSNWDGYDTHYTERYMGTPQSNPQGYRESSVLSYVENLQGHLLLVHGLIDENVHFRHTARLINALIHARKKYDLLLFPDERHMPRRLEDRIYMEQFIQEYFKTHL